MDETFAQNHSLRPLLRPVYLPSFVYAAGASAVVPAQVILALRLGFSTAGVAGVMTWIGAFAVFSSLAAGHLVDALGEHRALVVTTVAGAAGLVAACGAASAAMPGARWILVAALTHFDLVDAVWSVARQGLVADLAPPHARGRAMNLYGACQRLGRSVGPLVAAATLCLSGAADVLVVAAGIVLLATALFSRFAPVRLPAGASPPSSAGEPAGARSVMRSLLVLGIGVLVLTALRTAKEVLLPLWALQVVHLPDAQLALLMAASSAAELVLCWPAGVALDRCGRAPVVVTAMVLMGAGLAVLPLGHGVAWLVGCAAFVGLGDGAGAGIIKTLGIDIAPARQRGRFLGWWQSIASVGSFATPAVAGVLISATGLASTLVAIGMLGMAGAGWMAWWTPRLVPGPRSEGSVRGAG